MKSIELKFDVGDRIWQIGIENRRWKVIQRWEVNDIQITVDREQTQIVYNIFDGQNADALHFFVGVVPDEQNFFSTAEEAYAECDARNAKLPSPEPIPSVKSALAMLDAYEARHPVSDIDHSGNELPTRCDYCGVPLQGSLTEHKYECPFYPMSVAAQMLNQQKDETEAEPEIEEETEEDDFYEDEEEDEYEDDPWNYEDDPWVE